jgi:hypothetical protein
MPLPKITAPTYELTLPSTGKTVKYRPFLVKEEKILMLASESEDPKEVANAMKSVIKNCVITRLKVEDLCSFDIEYLFLNIRGKSVGEELTINMICPDDNETEGTVLVNVDDIKVVFPEGHTNEIELGDNLTVMMKYPNMDMFLRQNFTEEQADPYEIVSSCIDKIITDEDVYEASDCSKKELLEFIESMTSDQFMEVNKFFTTMPKLQHPVVLHNKKTGVDNELTLEGLGDFFG